RLSVAKTGENPNLQYNLRGLLFRQTCDRGVQRVVLRGWWGAEFHVRLTDLNVRCQAALVDAGVGRSQVSHRGQQQSAAIGKFHQLLACGASERALAYELGASVSA